MDRIMDKAVQRKPRLPGESREILIVNSPWEFDTAFDQFVAQMGPFKIIGVGFFSDKPPDNSLRKSRSAKAARRRRNRRLLRQRGIDCNQYAFDGGNNGNTTTGDAMQPEGRGFLDEGEEVGDDNSSSDESEQREELTPEQKEEEFCEYNRLRAYECGRVAGISISTLSGYTLLIRMCRFFEFPKPLENMLQGNEFLKIGFGIHGDKQRIYEKHNFFVLNFVDPRGVLYAWKKFVDEFHFERFGLFSVASHLFDQQLQNDDAAACLSSLWCAQDLNACLKRAASRKSQLTVDLYAEMCVQIQGRRINRYGLSPNVYNDLSFYHDLLSAADGHTNIGFDMKEFGIKVFATPAFQRRYRHRKGIAEQEVCPSAGESVPETFADRVRLRRSKSTIDKYWTAGLLYASFDVSLFEKERFENGRTSAVTLTSQAYGHRWEMKMKVVPKNIDRSVINSANMVPAIGHYKKGSQAEGKPLSVSQAISVLQSGSATEIRPNCSSSALFTSSNAIVYSQTSAQENSVVQQSVDAQPATATILADAVATANDTNVADSPQFEDQDDEDGFTGPRYSPVPPSPPRGRGRGYVLQSLAADVLSGANGNGSSTYTSNGELSSLYGGLDLDAGIGQNGPVGKSRGRGVWNGAGQIPQLPECGRGRGRGRGLVQFQASHPIAPGGNILQLSHALVNEPQSYPYVVQPIEYVPLEEPFDDYGSVNPIFEYRAAEVENQVQPINSGGQSWSKARGRRVDAADVANGTDH